MKIEAIEHVQLPMPPGQENAARAFYSGLLGLDEKAKPADLAKRGGAWFETAKVKIHLGVERDFRPAKKAHPAFLVSGLDDLARRLNKSDLGVTVDAELPGYNRFYVADPFGNRLEFMEPV